MHESVRDDTLARARHATFIVSRFAGSAIAAAALIAYLALSSDPEPIVVTALGCMALPALAALLVMHTGALAAAHLISALTFTLLIAVVAAVTGGLSSFVAAWFLVVPLEAAMSASRRVVALVVVACGAAIVTLGLLQMQGALPTALLARTDGWAYSLFGLSGALIYAGMLAATIEFQFMSSEAVVQDTQERYRLLAENATDMITCHAADGEVRFVSGAASSLVRCAPRQLMGAGLSELVHVEDRVAYACVFADAIRRGGPASVEFRLAQDVGDADAQAVYRWVELRCRPISRPARCAAPHELVAVTHDVTGRKHRQEQLRAARDAAEQASRAKTQFLANMSHELRTPLNSVIGFAELLEKGAGMHDNPSQRTEYASHIRCSGEHLLGVVNDLLDLSRIESGNVALAAEALDVNEIVRYCRHALEARAAEAEVDVVLQRQTDELVIDADRRACRQIVLNLLSNAIKFSNPGGRVMVSTRHDGAHAVIAVRDEGIGIDPELIGQLGQPFVQGDGAYSRSHEGTGLGLSIVKGLVSHQDGTMHIESTQGAGTCVTVTLPARPATAAPLPIEAMAAAGPQANAPTI